MVGYSSPSTRLATLRAHSPAKLSDAQHVSQERSKRPRLSSISDQEQVRKKQRTDDLKHPPQLKIPLRSRPNQHNQAAVNHNSSVPSLPSTRATRTSHPNPSESKLHVHINEEQQGRVLHADVLRQKQSQHDKRTLRSQDGGSRTKSELAMYFQNYEQMISLEPTPPGLSPRSLLPIHGLTRLELLTAKTRIVLIDDPLEPPNVQHPPSKPKLKSGPRAEAGHRDPPSSLLQTFSQNVLDRIHNAERIDLSTLDRSPRRQAKDPLAVEIFFKAHRRAERQEKQLRNIEKERAQHEKVQLDRLLDELRGHDWLRVMGISGITESEKKLYEPKRAYFIKEVAGLIEKFKSWKEEEKRRKVEREQALLAEEEDNEEQDDEDAEEADDEAEEEDDVLKNGRALGDELSDGDPPDYNDVDAWAARQLHQEAKFASAGRRPHFVPELLLPPQPATPFTSFYSKRYVRDAAISKHRKGRKRMAFGEPIPDMEVLDFDLPPEILTEDAIRAGRRNKRRLRRESKDV